MNDVHSNDVTGEHREVFTRASRASRGLRALGPARVPTNVRGSYYNPDKELKV
jgi:hypothetical protein